MPRSTSPYGPLMIFPPSWAQDPPDPPDGPQEDQEAPQERDEQGYALLDPRHRNPPHGAPF